MSSLVSIEADVCDSTNKTNCPKKVCGCLLPVCGCLLQEQGLLLCQHKSLHPCPYWNGSNLQVTRLLLWKPKCKSVKDFLGNGLTISKSWDSFQKCCINSKFTLSKAYFLLGISVTLQIHTAIMNNYIQWCFDYMYCNYHTHLHFAQLGAHI